MLASIPAGLPDPGVALAVVLAVLVLPALAVLLLEWLIRDQGGPPGGAQDDD